MAQEPLNLEKLEEHQAARFSRSGWKEPYNSNTHHQPYEDCQFAESDITKAITEIKDLQTRLNVASNHRAEYADQAARYLDQIKKLEQDLRLAKMLSQIRYKQLKEIGQEPKGCPHSKIERIIPNQPRHKCSDCGEPIDLSDSVNGIPP